ncbi:MAG: AarF/UbiB family protein, partial [Candidatus Caenarcaniphilales bacterium]|nr:AarF/UbiB family protein [Candidatus Caenarcaniphilales bacterium]
SILDQVLKELPKEVLDIFSRDYFGRSSQHKIEQIKYLIPKVAESIVIVDDTKDFLQNRVANLDKGNLTQKVSELRKASLESSRDKLLGLSEVDYIIIHGQEEFEREFLFEGRNNFTARAYAEFEQSNYTLTQLWHMWNQVFAAEFDAKAIGQEKLDFLLSTFTTKTFSRDQKIVEAIGYPKLNSWQDIVKVKEQISQESNIGLLFKLRDTLLNPILVNHLQRVIDKNVSNDLLNKLEDTAEIAAINSLDPSLLRDNPKLKKILLVYNTKSPFRDALIKPFIDAQNSQTLKLALSSLSTEPSQIDINNDKTGLQALESETILDVLSQFRETDKAEVLLYFLGKRSFDTRLLTPDQEITSINDFTNPDIFSQATVDSQDNLQAQNVLRRRHFPKELFCMPDALVRLLKMVGMDAQTMQDTMDSVSSDREQIEALDEILNGSNGILSKEKVKNYFFKNAASTIVNSAKIQFSSSINKETLARFLEFALSNCPREKLAVLFKNMWALTKTQNLTIEKLTAELLQSLGPAFIKFGQKLATMDLPESFKEELRKLSSQNTIADTSFFYHHLNSALKAANRFDPNHSGKKIGEGSMAATYQAQLAASNPLDMSSDQSHLQRAVKIIHPFIRDDIEMDIEFIRKLITFINDNSSDFGGLKIPANTADVIKARLMVQSDPQEEILRATLLKSNLSKSLLDVSFEAIEIDRENSAGLVIASKFKPGLELDKITDPEISKQSRNAVGLEILRQILQGDAYQSDPNLGNFGYIADKKKPKVFWYDSGSVEKIEKEDQKTLLKLIKAIATKKQDDISTLLLSLLKNSPEAFKSSIQSWIKTIKPNEKDAFANIKNIFESFVDLVARNNLELEDKWVSLADTLGYLRPLMEGIEPKLVTGLVKDSLKRADLLTTAEKIAIYFNGVGS